MFGKNDPPYSPADDTAKNFRPCLAAACASLIADWLNPGAALCAVTDDGTDVAPAQRDLVPALREHDAESVGAVGHAGPGGGPGWVGRADGWTRQ